ncbi:MAG TPA: hypothetical protein VFT46_05640 [Holophagaceae bacterium]|nr:hypothetical protein [Holophagaceae bacterium]
MVEARALRGLPPEEAGRPAERFFEALPWDGAAAPEPAELSAGAFLEAL